MIAAAISLLTVTALVAVVVAVQPLERDRVGILLTFIDVLVVGFLMGLLVH